MNGKLASNAENDKIITGFKYASIHLSESISPATQSRDVDCDLITSWVIMFKSIKKQHNYHNSYVPEIQRGE